MARFKVVRTGEEIKRPSELLNRVFRVRKISPTGAVWLRGLEKAEYALIPTIGRRHRYGGKTFAFDKDYERGILHRFRRYAYEYAGRELSEWEAVFVGRHFGLPTRIMDWTGNPYAGLYFACDWRKEGDPPDAKIWMLAPVDRRHSATKGLNVFDKGSGPFDVKGLRLVYPMVVASRINAQSAYFTIQDDPWTPLDELGSRDFPDDEVDILELYEFIVPAKKRFPMLRALSRFGVTRRTLFPDYGGLAQGLLDADILRWGAGGGRGLSGRARPL